MSSSLGETDAVLILVATLGMLAVLVAFLLVMLERLRRRRVLEKGLIHLVFLPERRRSVLRLISILAFFFILSGLNESLASLGLISAFGEHVISTIAYLGGAVCLFLLIWVGLRPAELTADRRAELERSSQELILLAFAPADVRDGDASNRD